MKRQQEVTELGGYNFLLPPRIRILNLAHVVELAYTLALDASSLRWLCGFESHHGQLFYIPLGISLVKYSSPLKHTG